MKNRHGRNWNEKKIFKEQDRTSAMLEDHKNFMTNDTMDWCLDEDLMFFIVDLKNGNAEPINDCQLLEC